ncbi:MAG: fibronectin type III domain-containing protein [Clostridia bacterium]|nr:fibronectin type III domain-containing protein [Clostridia bacterium]
MSRNKALISLAAMLLTLFFTAAASYAATYKYDSLNRLVEVTYRSGEKIVYTYDAGGNILSATRIPGGGDTQAPTSPTGLTASSVTWTSVRLTWIASTDNIGVKGYEIYRDGVKVKAESAAASTIGSLIPGTTYTFMVKAFDAAGNVSDESNTITVTTPADTTAPTVPAGLAVTDVTDSSITLVWTPSTDNVGVKGYEIYRNGAKIGTTTSETCTITRLRADTTYRFKVTAYDSAGNVSEASSKITAATLKDNHAPSTPANLAAASVTETTVRLTWAASTDNVRVKGYDIYRDGVKLKSEGSTASTIGGLIPGRSYTFMVKAFDAIGNVSAESNIITVTTLADTQAPLVPAGLTASSVTETSAVLTWTASTDNVGTTGYQIYRDGVRIASTNKTSFTATRLIPGRAYVFTVKAYDLAGNVSEASSEVSVTTLSDTQAPTAPTNLTASAVTATSVTLAWTASTDNAGVSGYVVYRDGVKVATISGTTYMVTGLTAGTTYNFIVKAYDVVSNLSDESSIVTVTVN